MTRRILSLGAGVQSTTMALMAERGEIDPPDAAIFCDTKWENREVYDHLAWLIDRLSFPVFIVSAGDIRADILAKTNTTGGSFSSVPWFFMGDKGDRRMGRRQCTSEYKLRPLHREIRRIYGFRPGQKLEPQGIEVMVGISTDEAMRMKPSREQWLKNVFPLIDMDMSRRDCLAWMARYYPDNRPPKSSCIGCPFHSDPEWRRIKSDPVAWADAIEVDKAIRDQSPGGKQYMHQSCKPLDQVDLSTAEERGQLNLFNNECEGMCGV